MSDSKTVTMLIPNISRFGLILELNIKEEQVEQYELLNTDLQTLFAQPKYFNNCKDQVDRIVDLCKKHKIEIKSISQSAVPTDENFIGFLPLESLHQLDINDSNQVNNDLATVWYVGLTNKPTKIKNTLTNQDIIVSASTYLIQSYTYPSLSKQIMFTKNPETLATILPPITDSNWKSLPVANIAPELSADELSQIVDYDSF